MPPVGNYTALPTYEKDEKHHLPFSQYELQDQDAFFTNAARSSNRHRFITLTFLTLIGGLYALLFGASLPNIEIPYELKPGNLLSSRPCPMKVAVVGYEAGVRNMQDMISNQLVEQDSSKPITDTFINIIQDTFLSVPTAQGAREALKRYTKEHHVAGQDGDYNLALQVLEEWSDILGILLPEKHDELVFDAGSSDSKRYLTGEGELQGKRRAWTDTYSVWLNYPLNSSLTLSKPDNSEPYFTASLKEDILEKDESSSHGVPIFHGYSASGAATGQVVYAGMGRKQDFEALEARGISLKGKVALVTYGGVFRGLKVRAAQEAGAVACLIYSDTIEDGEVTIENGYQAYPDGPARNPSAVQRGSVQGLSLYPGDPSTPEKPSYRNATRLDPEEADSLPKIPSLPISYQDAKPLLESLKGKGVLAKEINERMSGALPGIEYWTGPSDDVAHVENFVDLKVRDIWNTYAVLPGVLKDEVVVLGNHRDAWTFGAADPNSGTAAFHETIKGLAHLHELGWRPLRTLLFASWDAEEYGLVGSTEFGEDYAEWIKKNVVVYHNTDVSVSGSELHGQASPSLAGVLESAASQVDDPNLTNGTKLSLENPGPLGSGSDYTVFLQYLGIASTDLGFSRTFKDPIYHYHSNYDSFYWMDTFGDPGFKRHEAAAKVIGLTALSTSSSLFTPINVTHYSIELEKYLAKVEKLASETKLEEHLSLKGLSKSIRAVQKAAWHLDERKAKLSKTLEKYMRHHQKRDHKRDGKHLLKILSGIRRVNGKVREFEQGFISESGLRGRSWYKHLGVAPGRWLGYGSTTLPGLTEAILLDGGRGAQQEADRLDKHLDHMAQSLSRS